MTGSSPTPRRSLPACTSALRVYEPLAAFAPLERARWERYAEAGRAGGTLLEPRSALASEHATALQMLVQRRLDVTEDQALVRLVDGLAYVCPLDTQRRVWEALGEFRSGLADVVADAFVPRAAADEAAARLEAATATDPRPVHVLTATWHVPLGWFLLFEADESTLVLGSGPGDPQRSLTLATTMASARRRVARALTLLQRTIPEAPTVTGLEAAGRWLEEFHPYSRVELDHGGLVHVRSDMDLAGDTSVADLAEGLARLRESDGPGAAAAYERVVTRWRAVQAKETAS